MLEIVTKGKTKPIQTKAKKHLGSFNKLMAINFAEKIIISVKVILNSKDIGIIEKTKFLLFFVSSATSLLIATGKPKLAKVINKTKVGDTKATKPMPSLPRYLAKTIFLIMLTNLETKPPKISKITDLIKTFFFILKFIFLIYIIC